MFRSVISGFMALALAAAAGATAAAQPRARPAPAAPAPAPAIAPEEWWSDQEASVDARFDPLANRRWSRNDARVRAGFNNGVDASLYRLWGLQPLQGLSIRRGEAVFEVWFRPTDSSRQAVVRVIVRGDGRAFVQARAGRGCCAPDIARRVDINQELSPELRAAFVQLQNDPVWNQPKHVVISEGGDVVSSVCVNGASYDLTLVNNRRASHLRRSCDPVEVGSVAKAAHRIIGAAFGYDPRFDVVFSRERFDQYEQAYAELVAGGGSVAPATQAGGAAVDAAAEQVALPENPAQEILDADRAFAALAREEGAAKAFQEYMDPADGVLVRARGEPLRGAEAIYRHFGGGAPEAGKLLWDPVEAWVAESGDFGASWGRSEYIPNDPAQPRSFHRYVTVWRKDASGAWKGLLDIGAPAEDALQAAAAGAPLPPPPPAGPQPSKPPAAR